MSSKSSLRRRRQELDRAPIDIKAMVNSSDAHGLDEVMSMYASKIPLHIFEADRVPEESVRTTVVESPVVGTTVPDTNPAILPRKPVRSAEAVRTTVVETPVVETVVPTDSDTVDFKLESPVGTTVDETTVGDAGFVETTVVETPVVRTTVGPALWVTADKRNTYEARRTFEIQKATDSMTDHERSQVALLWQKPSFGAFQVLSQTKRSKIFQAGYDVLAGVLGVTKKSITRNTLPLFFEKQFLERRLAGFCKNGDSREASVWELFGYDEIRERQKRLGFTRAVRSGKAIHLVRPHTEGMLGKAVVETVVPTTVDLMTVVPTKTHADSAVETVVVGTVVPTVETVVVRTPVTVVPTTPHPYKLSLTTKETLNDDDDDVAVEKFHKLVRAVERTFDGRWIRVVFQNARTVDRTVEPELVFEVFCELRAELLSQPRGKIKNLKGLLYWNFGLGPEDGHYFSPALFEETRKEMQRAAEQAERNAAYSGALPVVAEEPIEMAPEEPEAAPVKPQEIAKAIADLESEIAFINGELAILHPGNVLGRRSMKGALARCEQQLAQLTQVKAHGAGN
jgi:hypothetical protein